MKYKYKACIGAKGLLLIKVEGSVVAIDEKGVAVKGWLGLNKETERD